MSYARARWLKESGLPWSDMNLGELYKWMKAADEDARYDFIDGALYGYRNYMKESGLRETSIRTALAIIRSFFKHNRVPLPQEDSIWSGYAPKTAPVDGDLSPENIRDVVLSCDVTQRAIFLTMFQASLDESSFLSWNIEGWESLQDQLVRGVHPIEIKINGRKRGRNTKPFHTYIGRDSRKAITDYLNSGRRPSGATAIFYTKNRKPVSRSSIYLYWLRHLHRLGIIKKQDNGKRNRYGKNPHEMRDTFRTQWERSGASAIVAEYCMGHFGQALDPNGYNKAHKDRDYRVKEYLKAEPYLNVISSAVPFGLIKESEAHNLLGKVADLEQTNIHLHDELRKVVSQMNELQNQRTSSGNSPSGPHDHDHRPQGRRG